MRVPHRPNAFHSIPTGAGMLPWQTTPHGRLVKADAEALLIALVDESVDLIIVDPAYESLEKWRAMGSTTRLKESKGSSNKWFQTFPNMRYFDLFEEMYRVLKRGTHLYMFSDEETRDLVCCGCSPQTGLILDHGRSPLVDAGFKFWKSIVWDKMLAGMGYHYRARHEFILMAEKVLQKGKHRRLNDAGPADVIPVRMLKGKEHHKCNCQEEHSTPKGTCKSSSVGGSVLPTSSSGRNASVPSPKGLISITETESRQTTGSETSNSSPRQITNESTPGANFATGCGGSHAKTVRSSNPSTVRTGTSPPTGDGLSTEGAVSATSSMSSSGNRRSGRCPRCGLLYESHEIWPTEKPYELIKLLVEQSTNPGDTVLDPMCGSGVVGEVCRDTGRRYILGDLDIEEAARRLS